MVTRPAGRGGYICHEEPDGCEYTVTFDKKAASLPGFDLLG